MRFAFLRIYYAMGDPLATSNGAYKESLRYFDVHRAIEVADANERY